MIKLKKRSHSNDHSIEAYACTCNITCPCKCIGCCNLAVALPSTGGGTQSEAQDPRASDVGNWPVFAQAYK